MSESVHRFSRKHPSVSLEEALLRRSRPVSVTSVAPEILAGIPRYGWYRVLHEAALAAGACCYQDPLSHELVPTAAFLDSHPEYCSVTASPHRHQTVAVTGAPGKTLFADHHDVSSDDESSSGSSGSGGARRQINKAIAQMQVLRMNNAATSSASLGEKVTAATAAARYRRRQGPAGPSPFLRRQSRPLLITELQDIEDILRLPHYAQTGRLHAAAEEVGLDSYRDPANGCIFYTRAFLSQSPCCGEECRHCPYGRVASFTFSAGNFESSETDTSSSSLSSSPPSSRSSSSPSGSETS